MTDKIDIVLAADQLEGTEATLSNWLVELGEAVTEGQPIVELETDKVSIEVAAPADGVVAEFILKSGDKVEPDALLGYLADAAVTATTAGPALEEPAAVAAAEAIAAQPALPVQHGDSRHLIGPAVRRLVAEHQLDFDRIPGTGRGGRVTRSDVVSYLNSPQAKLDKTAAFGSSAAAAPSPATPGSGGIPSRMVPHTTMRKAIANHMVESLLHTSPHVTSVFEMDMSNLIEHRKWHKKEFAEKGVKLTFTAYFLGACVKAMQAVPDMNARFHQEALEIFEDINIGVGTALGEAGLVVPVVKQVQHMDLLAIAQALDDQTHRARSGKLSPADMKDGTFTISNHGVSGSLFAAPIIINQPQVAILGIGKLEKRVEVVEVNGEDEIQIKPKCYVSLSIDHRAVDAFQTNAWLSAFVHEIENWGQ